MQMNFSIFLGYRERLYHAGSWENTGFGGLTSNQGTQFSPYLLPVCLDEGTLLGAQVLDGLGWLE